MHWKDWCWSWSTNTLATWWEEQTHWERPLCWERLKAGGEEGDRGWDGWKASPTQWTWVSANPRRQWRTGKPGVLQSTGSQSQTRLSDWITTVTIYNFSSKDKNSFLAPPTLDPYNYHSLCGSSLKISLNIFLLIMMKSILSSLLIAIITNVATFKISRCNTNGHMNFKWKRGRSIR